MGVGYIAQKPWHKQLFCKHEFVQAVKKSKFVHLQGRRIYTVCEKCGKVKDSYFKEEQ